MRVVCQESQLKTDPDIVDTEVERDSLGRTALLIAAANGNQVIVEYLLHGG